VASGGHLVLTISDTWKQVENSPLNEALPVDLLGTRDTDLGPLLIALGEPQLDTTPAPQVMAVPRKRPGRAVWVLAEDSESYALWSIGTYGLGTVTVMAADPTVEPLSEADRIRLWRRLLWLPAPATSPDLIRERIDSARIVTEQAGPAPSLRAALRAWSTSEEPCLEEHGKEELSWGVVAWERTLRERLSDIPGASPLPLSWLIGFSIVYLLVIGPGDYLVLRWMNKQPWTWVTFPITVVVFSGAALVGTAYTKGSQAVVTRVEIIDLLPGTDRWRGQTHLGVFSTRKTRLGLTSGVSDGVMGPMREAGTVYEPNVLSDEGPGQLSWRAETWTLGYAQSVWVDPGRGRFRLVETDEGLAIDNATGLDLAEVVLVRRGADAADWESPEAVNLGPLAVGERAGFASDEWSVGTPGEGDMHWAWRALRESPEGLGAHLHLRSWEMAVIAIAAEPVEDVVLTGLDPIHQEFTLLRAPLGAPTLPGHDAWTTRSAP